MEHLARAAEGAGLDALHFPRKSILWLYLDGTVEASLGRGAEIIRLL